jgi:cytochrome c peroxidase
MQKPFLSLAVVGVLLVGGCTDEPRDQPTPDAGADSGTDAGEDSGIDAALDAGNDAGSDASDEDAGGDAGDPPFEFTPMEREMMSRLSPLPAVPADPTNMFADDADAAALGQAFFFDKRFSGKIKTASGNDLGAFDEADKIACSSCHNGAGLDDQRTAFPRRVSLGADFHTRNAPSAINSVFYQWTNWGGRFSAPWELPIAVVENGAIMNGNRLDVAHIIYDNYRSEYEAVFGAMDGVIATLPAAGKPKPGPTMLVPSPPDGPWELVLTDTDRAIVNRVLINFGKAIEAYERLLVSRNAPFDQLVAGDDTALSEDAKRGARLFLGKARCVNCHSGTMLSDNQFHNLGAPQTGLEHVPMVDNGRFNDIPGLINSAFSSNTTASDDTTTGRLAGLTNPPPVSTKGQFRTPTLRGVTLTAPYMHSGQFDTLVEVIDFYDAGGEGFGGGASGTPDALLVPLDLTGQEKADLLSFLMALDGESIPSGLLVDPAAP